jgi:hypothetical protein
MRITVKKQTIHIHLLKIILFTAATNTDLAIFNILEKFKKYHTIRKYSVQLYYNDCEEQKKALIRLFELQEYLEQISIQIKK